MYKNYCRIRDSKGLKDSDIARMANVPKSTFSEWKNGRSVPKYEKLNKIAAALDVTYSELVGINEDKKIPAPEKAQEHVKLISLYEQLTESEQTIIMNTMLTFINNRTPQ